MNSLAVSPSSASAGVGAPVLWATVGALGLAVVGLGTLLYQQSQPVPPAPLVPGQVATLASPAPAVAGHLPATPAARDTGTRGASSSTRARPVPESNPANVQISSNESAIKSGAPGSASPAAVPVARATCADCATVTAVTPIEREGEGSGAGAVAGGVLGALVGQQFGGGEGKTLATIVGAVGGGMAGNAVEKKMKKVTVYQVELRLDDGSTRTLERATPVSVGARVRLNGNAIEPLTQTAG